ncbi:MAG: hypothetical protein RIR24_701 [Actinomycetota bacterium]
MAKKAEKISTALVDIRRAPKFLPFTVTAGALGLVISLVTAFAIQAPGNFFGYVVVWGTVLFATAGLILAVVLESIFKARSKRIEATKIEG